MMENRNQSTSDHHVFHEQIYLYASRRLFTISICLGQKVHAADVDVTFYMVNRYIPSKILPLYVQVQSYKCTKRSNINMIFE